MRESGVSTYRVIHSIRYTGCVDLGLGCCTILPGQYASTAVAYRLPARGSPKSKTTQPGVWPNEQPCRRVLIARDSIDKSKINYGYSVIFYLVWRQKTMLISCSSCGINLPRSAPLSAQIISSFSPKISQIGPMITFLCMNMLCKYYAFWEARTRRAGSARGQLGDARRSVCRQIWSTQVQCAILINKTVRRPLNALRETQQCAIR